MTTALAERPSTAKPVALPSAWVDRLFQRLAAAYGSEKFVSLFRNQEMADVKALWAAELSGLSADELRHGLEAMRAKHPSWPPSLYEFFALCRPTSAFDPEAAFVIAVRGLTARKEGQMGEWPNRAIYWTAMDVSAFDVLGSTWPQIRARWTDALRKRMDDPNPPQVPEPPKQLAAPTYEADADAEKRLQDMRNLVVKKDGFRSWAHAVLKRHENGDPNITPLALEMAKVSAAGGVWNG